LTLILSGDKKRALEKLREAVKEDSDNVQAYILYGDLLRDFGYHKRAAKIHRELTVREALKPELHTDIMRSLLLDYQKSGEFKLALEWAERLLADNRDDIWTLRKKLELLEALESWHKVFETARKIQSLTDSQDKEQLALYKVMEGKGILAHEGKEHDARLKYREALRLDSDCPLAYMELALSYVREERTEDAVKTWKEFFQTNPQHAYLAFEPLETTLFELGRFEELEAIYRRLINLNPKNTRAVVALARFFFRKGETAEAIRTCREGLETSPESLWIRRNLFRFLATEGRLQEAIELGLEVVNMVTSDTEEFICGNCHNISTEPLWRCPNCGMWRTFKF
jgi:lipopolysaccharide biosynthesis regulator YciM